MIESEQQVANGSVEEGNPYVTPLVMIFNQHKQSEQSCEKYKIL